MALPDLFPALRELNRADKLRAMQFLVSELAKEEDTLITAGEEYALWSPYNAFDAANTLLAALKAAETERDG